MTGLTKTDVFALACKSLNAEKWPKYANGAEISKATAGQLEKVREELEALEALTEECQRRVQGNCGDVVAHRELSNVYNEAACLALEAIKMTATARRGMQLYLSKHWA